MPSLDAPTALIASKYRLTRLLGRGGMGSVWEGIHSTLGTRVAVKFIESEHAHSPEARSRFENEARAAATLRSKHVVEVYDHGVSDDGKPFIVMEYLEGEPLDRRLDRLGRLPAKDTARILQQVCRALSKAHAAGIVHRDLKPENIFLVWDDEDRADIVKVVDFGIAKFIDSALGPSSATRTGSLLGTPYFMSPEQARGLRSVDHRSDLWSLGVIAFRCMVGRLPFEGEALGDLLVKLCTAPLPVPSQFAEGLPPGFDPFIARALSREPESRFQSAQEFSESLSAVAGLSARGGFASSSEAGSTLEAPPPASHFASAALGPGITGAPLTQTRPRTPSSRVTPIAVGVLGVVGLIGVVALITRVRGSDGVDRGSASEPSAAPAAELPRTARSEPPAALAPPTAAGENADPETEKPAPSAAALAAPSPRRPERRQSGPKGLQRAAPSAEPAAAAPSPPPPPPARPQPAPTRRAIDVGY